MKLRLHRLLLAAALLGSVAYTRAQESKPDDQTDKKIPVESVDTASDTQTTKAIKLQPVEVLGSRIHQVDVAGPSPVSTYNQDYIRATGAMSLADFLNKLPQNYAGISSGRGSAPNELNPEFGQRTETTSPLYDFTLGASAAPPGQTGVSGVSLRGLGSGSTLVLIDGRRAAKSGAGNRSTDSQQGFVDLNTIPLGMIDHIEVITDGASAIYGADAVAGVINIVLKKDYTGTELTSNYKDSFEGGGRERQFVLTSGFAKDKLRGVISLEYYDRSPLKASQRSFSRNQDHSSIVAGYDSNGNPVQGRDFRLLWGYPGVVQARSGTLNGITEAGGNQTRFAVINPGITGTPTLADFTASGPGQTGGASYIVRGNTSEFLDLIPKAERKAASAYLNYAVSDHVELYGRYSYTDSQGKFSTQPPVTTASAYSGFGNVATVVPAAYNPFGQDILVGQIHYGFGSISQTTETKAHYAIVGARGTVGDSWHWDAAYTWQRQIGTQVTRDFNKDGISALYRNSDPTMRLNPFVDLRQTGNTEAALYESLALYPYVDSKSVLQTYDFSADGNLFDIWGGPLKMAIGAEYNHSENASQSLRYSSGFFGLTTIRAAVAGEENTSAGYVEFYVPLIGKPNAVTGAERLDLQLAYRHENDGKAGNSNTPKVGLSWVPTKSLLVRGSYSEGFHAPDLTQYQVPLSSYNAYGIIDPKRGDVSTNNVLITRGANPDLRPETSTNEFYGIVIEPPVAKGLSLQVNYYRTVQKDAIQVLGAQTIVNAEDMFPGRVIRATPDPADTALGQPGMITAVNTTLVNFGRVENTSVEYVLEYVLPWREFGRWHVNFNASHTLNATHQLAPGQPSINDEGDTYAPPKWKYNGSIFWSKGPWTASVFVSHLSGFSTNKSGNTLTATYPISAQTNVDVRAGYEFKHGIVGNYGKGVRVNVGIGNVFDEKPAFSDTVFGYNGALHSPLGRSYELSVALPF